MNKKEIEYIPTIYGVFNICIDGECYTSDIPNMQVVKLSDILILEED